MSPGMTGATLAAMASGGLAACALLVLPAASGQAIATTGSVLAVMIVWIAWQDLRTFTIPDGPLLVVGMLGLALRLTASGTVSGEALSIGIDALLCGGALLAIREAYYRLKGLDGLGFGDVKLGAAGGVLLGTMGFAHALLAASALGLAVVLGISLMQPSRTIDRLPFGALLAPACGIVWALSWVTAGR